VKQPSPLYTLVSSIPIWLTCALYTYPSIPSFRPPPFLLLFLSYFSHSLQPSFLAPLLSLLSWQGFTIQPVSPRVTLLALLPRLTPPLGWGIFFYFLSHPPPPFQAYFNFLISSYLHPMPPLMTGPLSPQHLFTPAPQGSPTSCVRYSSIVSFPLFFSFSPVYFFFTILYCFSFSCLSLLPGSSGGFLF